jgi:hypothetical protein
VRVEKDCFRGRHVSTSAPTRVDCDRNMSVKVTVEIHLGLEGITVNRKELLEQQDSTADSTNHICDNRALLR